MTSLGQRHLLDFIVFGVARSGTGALARALNFHPNVYCAKERFSIRDNHSLISFPDSFIDGSTIERLRHRAKILQVKAELARKKDISHVGNKLPRYYLVLERLKRELPKLKGVLIYRSPRGFMPSWNRRELRGRRWPAGQVGLFGLLELFVCLTNCLRESRDILVFPYESGLNRSMEPILQALDFLGASPEVYDRHVFERKQLMREVIPSRQVPLADHEEEILDTLGVGDLDQLMDQGRAITISQLAVPLSEYMKQIAGLLPRAFDRAFRACADTTVQRFSVRYFDHYRAELDGLMKAMKGSGLTVQLRRPRPRQRFASWSRERLRRSLLIHFLSQRTSFQQRLGQVRWIARTMDDQFTIPGTKVRIGWDPIIGFLPVIGDLMTSGVSLVIVHHAWRLGAPSTMLMRMVRNIGVDVVVGCIPFFGDAFDFAWKANRKNVDLLESHIAAQRASAIGLGR
jgi:hypothetical protein